MEITHNNIELAFLNCRIQLVKHLCNLHNIKLDVNYSVAKKEKTKPQKYPNNKQNKKEQSQNMQKEGINGRVLTGLNCSSHPHQVLC